MDAAAGGAAAGGGDAVVAAHDDGAAAAMVAVAHSPHMRSRHLIDQTRVAISRRRRPTPPRDRSQRTLHEPFAAPTAPTIITIDGSS